MEVKQVFPIFEEGRILKRDSLDFIRDYAPDFFSLLFREYGDGVIVGFPVHGDGKKMDSSISPDFKTERFELLLEPVRVLGKGEYELGRFLLEQGARLRSYEEYKDFNDLITEFNTLNPVYIPFACEGGNTLAPFILRLYGRSVLSSPKAEPLDLCFSAACLSSPCVSAELIQSYLSAKERGISVSQGNWDLYQGLKRLYAKLVSGGEKRQKSREMGGKTMID